MKVPVKVSDGEHVFTPQERAILEAQGIDLTKLAPNAEQDSFSFKKGGFVPKGYAQGTGSKGVTVNAQTEQETINQKYEKLKSVTAEKLSKKYPGKKIVVSFSGDSRTIDQAKANAKSGAGVKNSTHIIGGARDFSITIDGKAAPVSDYKEYLWPTAKEQDLFHLRSKAEGGTGQITGDNDAGHIGLVQEYGDGTAFKRIFQKYPSLRATPQARSFYDNIVANKKKNPIDTTYDDAIRAFDPPKQDESIKTIIKDPNLEKYLGRIRQTEVGDTTSRDARLKNKSGSGAQGPYQFKKTTRDEILSKYGYDAYSDDPQEQDLAATALAKDRKGLDHILKGNYDAADIALNKTWTGLPSGAESAKNENSRKVDNVPAVVTPQTNVAVAKKVVPPTIASKQNTQPINQNAKTEKNIPIGATYNDPNPEFSATWNGKNWIQANGEIVPGNSMVESYYDPLTKDLYKDPVEQDPQKLKIIFDNLESKKQADEQKIKNSKLLLDSVDWDKLKKQGTDVRATKLDLINNPDNLRDYPLTKEAQLGALDSKQLEQYKNLNKTDPKSADDFLKNNSYQNLVAGDTETYEYDSQGNVVRKTPTSVIGNQYINGQKISLDGQAVPTSTVIPSEQEQPLTPLQRIQNGTATAEDKKAYGIGAGNEAELTPFERLVDQAKQNQLAGIPLTEEEDAALNPKQVEMQVPYRQNPMMMDDNALQPYVAPQANPLLPIVIKMGPRGGFQKIDNLNKDKVAVDEARNYLNANNIQQPTSLDTTTQPLVKKKEEFDLGQLAAQAQIAGGLMSTINQKRPIDAVDPAYLKSVADAQVTSGLSPAEIQSVNNDIEYNRRSGIDTAVDASGGSTAVAMGNAREATQQANESRLKLTALDADLRRKNKQYATGLLADLDARKRKIFEDSNTAFKENQSAGAALLGAGIDNLVARQRAKRMEKFIPDLIKAGKVDYGTLNK